MSESLGNNTALIDFVEDGSFFIIETGKEIFDLERLESVEKYLVDNFLLPYWVGDEEKMPQLSKRKWANSLDDDEIDYEIRLLIKDQKNPINNIRKSAAASAGSSWYLTTSGTTATNIYTISNI